MKTRFSHKWLLPFVGLSMVLGLGSCSDFLDEYSQDLVVAKNIQDLNELLIGDVYIQAHRVDDGMGFGTMAFINCLDDDISTTGTSAQGNIANTAWESVVKKLYGHYTWQQDVRVNYGETSKPEDNTTWNDLYKRINHANNIIDLVDDMPRNTDEEKTLYHRVKGEAHFLRAQFYFALANLYSSAYSLDSASTALCVPLKLSPNVEHSKEKKTQFVRASQEAVYNSIVTDLRTAQEELTLSPQPDRYRLHRASAEAAGVLLSRVYLYMQKWAEAETTARTVIASPKCQIASLSEFAPNQAFLVQGAKEVLFSQGSNHISPADESTSLSASPGDFCVSRNLYNSFATNDVRRSAFFSTNSLSDSISLLQKYARGLSLNHISDCFLLRSSEAYLNLAEALVMQKSKDSEALRVLNDFRRHRFDAYADTTATGEDLAKLIREERRREFCFEGQRWFDLRRYAVNKVYPFAKEIVHAYNAYTNSAAFLTTHFFRLSTNDPAYTFALPPKVLEFDKEPMPSNYRPKREEVRIIKTGDDDPVFPIFDDDDDDD